jgi:alginate O-acetyltransferase complex protein AlgI
MHDALNCDTLFHTYCFIFVFLPLTLAGYWFVPNRRWKIAWLAFMSLVFYSFWDIRYSALLLVSTAVDFFLALQITRDRAHAKAWLVASILFNLGVLGFFKYAVFAVESARSLFDIFGLPFEAPHYQIVLPLGISFYIFQTLSYTIDVYRRDVEPTRDLVKFLAFVTLFPQLVAGPIVRYKEVTDQLDNLPKRMDWAMTGAGLSLFIIGLAKKLLVADRIGARIDPIWADPGAMGLVSSWAATLGYALQYYFDFSGYSDMAIGLGLLLGLRFPVNFRAPFQALNPSDFWRRWHITLMRFVRDYLYIPLGGNRVSFGRWAFIILFAWALIGLWHGAGAAYLLWGLFFAVVHITYRATKDRWDRMPRVVQLVLMQVLFAASLPLLRGIGVNEAGTVFAAMFGLHAFTTAGVVLLVVFILLYAFAAVVPPAIDWRIRPTPTWIGYLAVLFFAITLYLAPEPQKFLYYQF